MTESTNLLLKEEMRALISGLSYHPYPWSAWYGERDAKEMEAKHLLVRLNRVKHPNLSIEIWQCIFASAYNLGLALQGIEYERLRNSGNVPNPKSEFETFLKLYPPASEAAQEQRTKEWRNDGMKEFGQRKVTKKIMASAKYLVAEISNGLNFPLIRWHLAESGEKDLSIQLKNFINLMDSSLAKQPYQEAVFVRIKRDNLCRIESCFRDMTGRPQYSLVANFAQFVSPKIDRKDKINFDSVKKEIQSHKRSGSFCGWE